MTYRIEANHFVAGIVVTDSVVTEAAPIIRYMRGWAFGRVLSYCLSKRWTLEKVDG